MKTNIEQARQLHEEKRTTEAIDLLQRCLQRETDEREDILLELGIIYNSVADFPRALNHFNEVMRLNAANARARTYIEMIRGILDYYNKELLNP
jgi:tetratricopeptide (TPR) repeat protein